MINDTPADSFPKGRAKLDLHCPYDETQLRQGDKEDEAQCPVCWSVFPKQIYRKETQHGG